MTVRTIAQVLKTHDEVVKAIKIQIASAGKPKPVKRDHVVKQKEQKLKSLQARLAGAQQDKQALIARMDKDIALLSKRIKNFEEEIKADKKNLKALPGSKPKPKPKPKPKAKPKAKAKPKPKAKAKAKPKP